MAPPPVRKCVRYTKSVTSLKEFNFQANRGIGFDGVDKINAHAYYLLLVGICIYGDWPSYFSKEFLSFCAWDDFVGFLIQSQLID